jgi:anti-sigma factor RsiW
MDMTTSPPHSQITDELLSAYIDGNVSESERILVETATQRDLEVAWRLETLRQTVQLLRALPQIALPRSFSVEAVLASERGAQQARTPWSRPAVPEAVQLSWWQAFLDFWRSGSPILRNAAVGAMALFLVIGLGSQTILVSNQIVTPAAIQSLSSKQVVQPMEVEAGTTAQMQQGAPAESTANVDILADSGTDAALGEQTNALLFATPDAELQSAVQSVTESAASDPMVLDLPDVTTQDSVVVAADAPAEDEPQIAAASAPSREQLAPAAAAKSVGEGAEDVTAFDAVALESVAAPPAALKMAPVSEITAAPAAGGEESAVARAPVAAAILPAATTAPTDNPTSTPTIAPTPTNAPIPTATLMPTDAPLVGQSLVTSSQTMQDSARLRLTPPSREAAAESSSLPAWLWMVQWGAAILAPVFFVLWLRSRRVDGKR